ncbi:MAG: hypothetical protein WAM82_10220 [Thermoanaerobaculia bacterium]
MRERPDLAAGQLHLALVGEPAVVESPHHPQVALADRRTTPSLPSGQSATCT